MEVSSNPGRICELADTVSGVLFSCGQSQRRDWPIGKSMRLPFAGAAGLPCPRAE